MDEVLRSLRRRASAAQITKTALAYRAGVARPILSAAFNGSGGLRPEQIKKIDAAITEIVDEKLADLRECRSADSAGDADSPAAATRPEIL